MKREDQRLLKGYQADLRLLEKEYNNTAMLIHEVKTKIAQLTAEFKVGDKIIWKHGKGTRTGLVDGVYMKYGEPAYVVKPIRKDGSLGARMNVETFFKKVWGTKT